MSDGYLVFAIDFENGQPKHLATSKTAAISILSNKNTESACDLWHPLACFRPTGLAFDSKGSLYMSSDVTGEIYVIGRANGSSVDSLTAVEPTV